MRITSDIRLLALRYRSFRNNSDVNRKAAAARAALPLLNENAMAAESAMLWLDAMNDDEQVTITAGNLRKICAEAGVTRKAA